MIQLIFHFWIKNDGRLANMEVWIIPLKKNPKY